MAIICAYSLFHVTREKHLEIFQKWSNWLRPDGKVLFTYATKEYTGKEEFDGTIKFMGGELFYSHDNETVLLQKLAHSGLTIESFERHTIHGETFLWVMDGVN